MEIIVNEPWYFKHPETFADVLVEPGTYTAEATQLITKSFGKVNWLKLEGVQAGLSRGSFHEAIDDGVISVVQEKNCRQCGKDDLPLNQQTGLCVRCLIDNERAPI